LPSVEGDKVRKQFKQYPIGYFHIGIAEVQTAQGKLYLFVAIDRTSKFAHVELHAQSDRTVAAAFLRSVIKAIPYKIHTILTDNGAQFCHPPRYRNGPTARYITHMFDLCYREQVNHP
jgi:transposase-like protein